MNDSPFANEDDPPTLPARERHDANASKHTEAWDSSRYGSGNDPDSTHFQPISLARPDDGLFTPEVPGYDIYDVLGRGGMGVVYRAKQIGLNRLVALKMILAGAHAESEDRDRFRQEAEAIAKLTHRNIVQVFETGDNDGMPYFSMEYCTGGSLARYLRGQPIDAYVAAHILEQLADGIHAAHSLHIIHRDLKPGNILLQLPDAGKRPGDGLPDTALLTNSGVSVNIPARMAPRIPTGAIPKITDFGLAKNTDDSLPRTKTGWIVGTPSYMAPEQARQSISPIGPATDIYALGSILYEMLTGRPPFKAANDLDTIHQLLYDDPIPPGRLEPKIPRDLETICLKCLEKDPRKRYTSGEELATDLAHFRNGEPISARPISPIERTYRWMRKRPSTAALVAISGFVFITGLIAWATFTARQQLLVEQLSEQKSRIEREQHNAQEQRARAEEQLELAQKGLYGHRLVLAAREADRGNLDRALQLLEECRWDLRGWEWRHLKLRCELAMKQPPLPVGRTINSFASPPQEMEYLQGDQLLTSHVDGSISLWDVRTGQHIRSIGQHPDRITAFAVHPDGKRLLTAGRDHRIIVWNIQTGEKEREYGPFPHEIHALRIKPDGQSLMSHDRLEVRLWDWAALERRQPLASYRLGEEVTIPCIAFSANGEFVAVNNRTAQIVVLRANLSEELIRLQGHTAHITAIAFHPDSDHLVSASEDSTVKLWSVERQGIISTMMAHRGVVHDVRLSSDGTRIGSVGDDGNVIIWDSSTGQELLSIIDSARPMRHFAFSPDRLTISTMDDKGVIRILNAAPERGDLSFSAGSAVACVHFDASGEAIWTGTHEGVIQKWDARTGKQLFRNADHQHTVTGLELVNHSDNYFVSVEGDPIGNNQTGSYRLSVWDPAIGKPRICFKAHDHTIVRVAVDPSGSYAATVSLDFRCRLWDIRTGRMYREFKVGNHLLDVAFQPDGPMLVAASRGHTIHAWNWRTGESLGQFEGHSYPITALTFSHDGKTLVSAAAPIHFFARAMSPAEIIVWDVESKTQRFQLKGSREPVWQMRFHPNDRLLVAAGGRLSDLTNRGELKLWDAQTGDLLHDYSELLGVGFGVDFAPSGDRFVTGSGDGKVRIWAIEPKWLNLDE